MSYLKKQTLVNKPFPKTRKPIKHQISRQFNHDLPLLNFNPFSQQLTPWNGNSKLEASINLLAKDNFSKVLPKHHSIEHQPTVQQIVQPDNIDYATLALRSSYEKPSSRTSSYTCPRLKIINQQSTIDKNPKQQAKRYLFNKKPRSNNKNVKKIANLTIEWDEQIVYNPQKKHFQQQSMKRKILREFSHTRTQNRNHQISKKDQKSPEKLLKFQFKNNKIHGKEVSVFQFKKKQLSLEMNNNSTKKGKQVFDTTYLQTLIQNNQNNSVSQIKINTLDFKPQGSGASLEIASRQNEVQSKQANSSEKWNFRTSLKARLPLPHSKKAFQKVLRNKQVQQDDEIKQKQEKQALNRITLQFQESIKSQKFAPLQVLCRTSPHFFRKQAAL